MLSLNSYIVDINMGFKERVEGEKVELDEKITKLGSFLETDIAKGLQPRPLQLLVRQHEAMKVYSGILASRLELM